MRAVFPDCADHVRQSETATRGGLAVDEVHILPPIPARGMEPNRPVEVIRVGNGKRPFRAMQFNSRQVVGSDQVEASLEGDDGSGHEFDYPHDRGV